MVCLVAADVLPWTTPNQPLKVVCPTPLVDLKSGHLMYRESGITLTMPTAKLNASSVHSEAGLARLLRCVS